MSQTHTIVVRFTEGIVPRYSAATEFQGGRLVAVAFDGNRLDVEEALHKALELMLEECEDDEFAPHVMEARAALAKAQGGTDAN